MYEYVYIHIKYDTIPDNQAMIIKISNQALSALEKSAAHLTGVKERRNAAVLVVLGLGTILVVY